MYAVQKRKCIVFTLLLLVCSVFFSSCTFVKGSKTNLPELRPDDGLMQEVSAVLYYSFLDYDRLVGIATPITVSQNESVEEAVVRALIDGDAPSAVASGAIPPDVRVIEVSLSGNILYVTLDKSFVDTQSFAGGQYNKALSIAAIVNTMTKFLPQVSVMVLVDFDDNGVGERLSYSKLGMYDMPADGLVEPMEFSDELVADAGQILDFALSDLETGSYENAARLFCTTENSVLTSAVLAQTFGGEYKITMHAIGKQMVSYSGDTTFVNTSLTVIDRDGSEINVKSASLAMYISDGIFKVEYEGLLSAIENAKAGV